MKTLIEHEVQLVELFAKIETDDFQIVKMGFGETQWASVVRIMERRSGITFDIPVTEISFVGVMLYVDTLLDPMDYSIYTNADMSAPWIADMYKNLTNEEAYQEAKKLYGPGAYVSFHTTHDDSRYWVGVDQCDCNGGRGKTWKEALDDKAKRERKMKGVEVTDNPPLLFLPKE
jgi:hypothetical protein